MKTYKIGNIYIDRFEDFPEDTLRVSSEHLEESIQLINESSFKKISIGGMYHLPDIDFLQDCKDVEEIQLNREHIKDFSGLSAQKNLKVLSMNELDKKVKPDLSALVSLEQLWGQLPSGTKGLSELRNLKEVHLWGYKPKSRTLAELGNANKLEVLHLIQSTIVSLEGIGQLNALYEMDLYGLNKLTDISDLRHLGGSLTKLTMENCKSVEDFSPIGSLVNVEGLILRSCGQMASIQFTKAMSKLTYFYFENTDVADGDLSGCERIAEVRFTKKRHFSNKQNHSAVADILLPTIFWRERMEEGDDAFTPENIQAAETTLKDYLANIHAVGKQGTQKKLLACVKQAVLAFNQLNEIYDGFIETQEREELAEYLSSVAELAGLETDGDVTEEWREW